MKQMAFGSAFEMFRISSLIQLMMKRFLSGTSAADVRGLKFSYFNNPGNNWGLVVVGTQILPRYLACNLRRPSLQLLVFKGN